MEKLKIFMLDSNQAELNYYGNLCSNIAVKHGVQIELKLYANSQNLLFDLDDPYTMSTLSVLIVEPDSGYEAIPPTVRKMGYKGLIVYLSRLASEACYLQAFNAQAYQFIKKGEKHLQRFYTVFEQVLKAAESMYREYIVVSGYGEYKQIQINEIYYFEARDKLMTVHYTGGQFEFFSTLQRLEERLQDQGFVRVNKSYLVSMEHIHKYGYEKLVLNDGTEIAVGRSYYPALKTRWIDAKRNAPSRCAGLF